MRHTTDLAIAVSGEQLLDVYVVMSIVQITLAIMHSKINGDSVNFIGWRR